MSAILNYLNKLEYKLNFIDEISFEKEKERVGMDIDIKIS